MLSTIHRLSFSPAAHLRRFLAGAACFAALGGLSIMRGQTTFYWDRNGSTTGAGSTTAALSGIWDTSTANWNTNSGGTTAAENFTSGGIANFSAGTSASGVAYVVMVSGTQNTAGITIQEGTPTFMGGTVNFNDATPALSIGSGLTLNWGSTALTSTTNTLNVSGGGVLNFTADKTFAGTVNISGGTLRLTDTDLTLGTLNITGNTIIDFAGAASSLNLTNLAISAGVTLTIQNWQNAVDFFASTNWTGAAHNVTGSTPMNQIVFNGFTGNNTGWASGTNEIRPFVPEPSLYGAFLLGLLGALGLRRKLQP